ncbi:hypothetical protein [Pseudomonas sp. S09G 359]|jgi:hypothetical protein|uniref:hypothetical protein n=1 Tax=Pseudomonas sp. S09G 359 TaxID=2054919 RepID=UPI000C6E1202|nr:hypothetical protein [Pseudomonas sp. S09G 359]AUG05369.1 hypothetical protein CXQ82_01805 [Pseudomonas sp. S09G 359]
MNPTRKTLYSLTLLLGPLSGAQAIPAPSATAIMPNAWTVEAPTPTSTLISARIAGFAAHADETSIAFLHVACYRSPLRPIISLYTHTDELRFNPNIYEGPDARSTGPLSLTTGALPTHTYRVNGYYSAEPTQQHGVLFKFTMPANRQELREWISDDMGGKIIKIKLPSAIPGDAPLTADFVLPHRNSGLREVITPCLNNRKTTPKKPS